MTPERPRLPLEPEMLARAYLAAKAHVIDSGYAEEIDWQEPDPLGTRGDHRAFPSAGSFADSAAAKIDCGLRGMCVGLAWWTATLYPTGEVG